MYDPAAVRLVSGGVGPRGGDAHTATSQTRDGWRLLAAASDRGGGGDMPPSTNQFYLLPFCCNPGTPFPKYVPGQIS